MNIQDNSTGTPGGARLDPCLTRYIGTPELPLMAAINLLKQAAKEYDPTITGLWVQYDDIEVDGKFRLSAIVFDRSSKAMAASRKMRGEA